MFEKCLLPSPLYGNRCKLENLINLRVEPTPESPFIFLVIKDGKEEFRASAFGKSVIYEEESSRTHSCKDQCVFIFCTNVLYGSGNLHNCTNIWRTVYKWTLGWQKRSWLKSFKDLSKILKRHWEISGDDWRWSSQSLFCNRINRMLIHYFITSCDFITVRPLIFYGKVVSFFFF